MKKIFEFIRCIALSTETLSMAGLYQPKKISK